MAGIKITRRSALKAAPAIAAAVAVPAVAVAGVSPLRALYYEWQESKTLFNTDDRFQAENEAGQELFEAIHAIEEEAAAFVAQSVEDWAFKIIFADDDGDMNAIPSQTALVDFAYQTVGITPGRWFHRFG